MNISGAYSHVLTFIEIDLIPNYYNCLQGLGALSTNECFSMRHFVSQTRTGGRKIV